jgi:putative ABC transport system permease protein
VKNPFDRRKREFDEEIQAHLRMAAADRRERGESEEAARTGAVRELGNPTLLKDITRATWGWLWLERLAQDCRYALRQLRKSPAFTLAAMGTLALGLGATAAMFTVVDRVLLRPLPYQNAGELLNIHATGSKGPVEHVPYLDIQQWRQASTLQDLAFHSETAGVGHLDYLEGRSGVTQVFAPRISGNLTTMLGVQPAKGRGFREAKATGAVHPDDAHTMILSDAVWRTTYGADESILGKMVRLSGEPYTVIGVMPRGFVFPYSTSNPLVWTPIVLGDGDKVRDRHESSTYTVIARKKRGVRQSAVEAELKLLQAGNGKSYTDPYERDQVKSVEVVPYSDSLVNADLQKSLWALLGASAVLWLIACVNVTSLLLARATARQREIAVRGALGASRTRILLQLLVEGLVLSLGASLLGAGLSMFTLAGFKYAFTEQLHIDVALTPNLPIILALFALTVVSALLACLWPAYVASSAAIEPALRQGATSPKQYRTRFGLVVMEIAMSLTLLVGCGLLLRTLYALRHVPLGFRTDHIVVANLSIPAYKYQNQDIRLALYQPLLERAQHLPGVESAALMTEVPLGKTFQMIFTFGLEGKSAADLRRRDMRAQFRAVSPDVQKVFGFRMLKGRFFNQGDTTTSAPVVVVNRAFVKAYESDNADPAKMLGQNLLGYTDKRRATVVGVLDDERQVSVAEQSMPEIEVCLPQITPDSMFYKGAEDMAMDLAVRTQRDPAVVVPELRTIMRQASPELFNSNITTMNQIVEDSFANQNLAAHLLQIFAGGALLLCVSGIYGLLAYLVTQRTQEMGLRIALGAQRAHVIWLVLREALGMLLTGATAGLLLAWLATQVLRTFLYGVKSHDPWTMAVVTLLLLASGLAAAYFPARRAAKIDPMQSLRTE